MATQGVYAGTDAWSFDRKPQMMLVSTWPSLVLMVTGDARHCLICEHLRFLASTKFHTAAWRYMLEQLVKDRSLTVN